jgi:hypothetical protein
MDPGKCLTCGRDLRITFRSWLELTAARQDTDLLTEMVHTILELLLIEKSEANALVSENIDDWFLCSEGHINLQMIDLLTTEAYVGQNYYFNVSVIGAVLKIYNIFTTVHSSTLRHVKAYDHRSVEWLLSISETGRFPRTRKEAHKALTKIIITHTYVLTPGVHQSLTRDLEIALFF